MTSGAWCALAHGDGRQCNQIKFLSCLSLSDSPPPSPPNIQKLSSVSHPDPDAALLNSINVSIMLVIELSMVLEAHTKCYSDAIIFFFEGQ